MIALIYFLLLSTSYAHDNGLCGTLVTAKKTQDHTEGLIALFEDLLERQILSVTHLNKIAEGLEQNIVTNPFSEAEAFTSSTVLIHRQAIKKFLEYGKMDNDRLLKWALNSLKEKGEIRDERVQVSESSLHDIFYPIEFYPIPAGDFRMGPPLTINSVKTTLTNPFEMMSTPVTQFRWVKLMGKNPSHFASGIDSATIKINGDWVQMNPDNPVEKVTWWSAVVFANRLSEQMGYKPTYDLDGVTFDPATSAEKGNLAAIDGHYKINSPSGKIYDAEGFRLPTSAEVEYVLKSAGKTDREIFHFGSGCNLEDYLWYAENSDFRTHPVAQLKPLIIGKNKFFDMPGHVWIWTNDSKAPDLHQNSIDPQDDSPFVKTRLAVGGCYGLNSWAMRPTDRLKLDASKSGDALGFRLVRTLPK